jgi:hypothetical protein
LSFNAGSILIGLSLTSAISVEILSLVYGIPGLG